MKKSRLRANPVNRVCRVVGGLLRASEGTKPAPDIRGSSLEEII